jgi:hypothetical protein
LQLDCRGSGFGAESELFDDGVGEDLAGDAFDFDAGFFRIDAVFDGQEEVLALANIGNVFVFHATQGVGDGLALGIENRAFESDVNVSLHYNSL